MFSDVPNRNKSVRYSDVKKIDDKNLLIEDQTESSNFPGKGGGRSNNISRTLQNFQSSVQLSMREAAGLQPTRQNKSTTIPVCLNYQQRLIGFDMQFKSTDSTSRIRDFLVTLEERGKEFKVNNVPKQREGYFGDFLNLRSTFFDLKQRIVERNNKKRLGSTQIDSRLQEARLRKLQEIGDNGASFRSNWTKSFKYTPLTFLPKNLFMQFQRIPNCWFLITSVISQIDLFSNSGSVGIYLLVAALTIRGLVDFGEDWGRHHTDWEYNTRKFFILRKQGDNHLQWMVIEQRDICVGDIILVQRDHFMPADVIVLATSGKNLASYVKTTNLDGEANMKVKYAQNETQQMFSQFVAPQINDSSNDEEEINDDFKSRLSQIQHLQGASYVAQIEKNAISCDLPNNKINQFNGIYLFSQWQDGSGHNIKYHVNSDNVILRGCQLKNTEWVMGVVTYAGKDAKIMQNQVKGPRKKNKVETATNISFFIQLIFVLIACFILAVFTVRFIAQNANQVNSITGMQHLASIPPSNIAQLSNSTLFGNLDFDKQVNYHWYFSSLDSNGDLKAGVGGYFLAFVQIVLLINQCVPIGVLWNLDIVQLRHASTLNADPSLVHHLKKKKVNFQTKQKLDQGNNPTQQNLRDPIKKEKNKDQKDEEKISFQCRTTTLGENLACIKYIFSDKTGTLTENELSFISCMIDGHKYGHIKSSLGLDSQQSMRSLEEDSLFHKITSDQDIRDMLRIQQGMQANIEIDLLTQQESTNIPEYQVEPQVRKSMDRQKTRFLQQNQSIQYQEDSMKIMEFWRAFAICNQIDLIENRQVGDETQVKYKFGQELSPLAYQGQSPDDITACEAAQQLGLELVYRDLKKAKIKNHITNQLENVKILAINKFKSSRRRMSVLCQMPSGTYRLYCKGADQVIIPRLKQNQNKFMVQNTEKYIDEASKLGLRAMCIASRDISPQKATQWLDRFQKLQINQASEDQIEIMQNELEQELELIGASVVEDKLQDGVQDTIKSLQQAGINIWMLTGDMLQTAMSIGKSCQLLTKDMENSTIVLSKDTVNIALKEQGIDQANFDLKNKSEQTKKALQILHNVLLQKLDRIKQQSSDGENQWALVIEGDLIGPFVSKDLVKDFFKLCQKCKAVICCRASPQQKAEVVSMVKQRIPQCTLAIGDGENDAVMIKQSDVGVGLSGKEGNSAVQSSDFAMGRFRFLKHLLLVRGRWINYNNQIMCYYYLYKALPSFFVLAWFIIYTGFSATNLYATAVGAVLEALCLFAILYFSFSNQDVHRDILIEYPELYQEKNSENYYTYITRALLWIGEGFVQSLIIFYVLFQIYQWNSNNGTTVNYSALGVSIFLAVVITVNIKVLLMCDTFATMNRNAFIMVFFGFVLFIVIGIKAKDPYLQNVNIALIQDARFWLGAIILTPSAAILPDFLLTIFKPMLYADQNKLKRVALMRANRDYIKGRRQLPQIQLQDKLKNKNGKVLAIV